MQGNSAMQKHCCAHAVGAPELKLLVQQCYKACCLATGTAKRFIYNVTQWIVCLVLRMVLVLKDGFTGAAPELSGDRDAEALDLSASG